MNYSFPLIKQFFLSVRTVFFIFQFLIFLITSFHLKGQYSIELVSQNQAYSDGEFCFLNKDVGFYITLNQILKTSDGGNTWDMQVSDIASLTKSDGLYASGCFVSENLGWVVLRKYDQVDNIADTSFLYKTINGGLSWELKHISYPNTIPYSSAIFSSVYFKNDLQGWVYGDGILEYTIDGGDSWSTIFHNVGDNLNSDYMTSFLFTNDTTAYISGYGAWIQQSIDDGITWGDQHYYSGGIPSDDYYIYDIDFSNEDFGVASISKGKYKITMNGGQTWLDGDTYLRHGNNAVAIRPYDQSIWFASGDFCDSTGCYNSSGLAFSVDSGNTWLGLVDELVNNRFCDVVWPTSDVGFASTRRGDVFKIIPDPTGICDELSKEVINAYPNPFVDYFELDEKIDCSISVYSITGELIFAELGAFKKRYRVETDNWKNGTYLCIAKDRQGKVIGTKRIVKLK